MKSKIISILLSLIILLSISTNTAFAAQTISIKIDGVLVPFNDQSGYPFVDENNRTQVPFRAALEAFGAVVEWDGEKQIAIATKNGIKVEVPIGESYILKNSVKIQNDTKALIKNGRTYLPIRAVMEAFGCTVSWDGEAQAVLIKTGITSESVEAITELTPEIIERLKSYPYYGKKEPAYGFETLQSKYPERLSVIYNDCLKLIPELIESNDKFITSKNLIYSAYNERIVLLGVLQTKLSDGAITEIDTMLVFQYVSPTDMIYVDYAYLGDTISIKSK